MRKTISVTTFIAATTLLTSAAFGADKLTISDDDGTYKTIAVTSAEECHAPFEITPPTPLDLNVAVAELNAYRAAYGLGLVSLNDKLTKASEVHARDLAKHGMAAHEGSDGSTHGERVKRQNYNYQTVGENVATGQKSWDIVFQAWKDSPGHNKNLLAEGVEDFGIALVYEPTTTYTTYWTMLVGTALPEYSPAAHLTPVQNKAMADN